jgi:hypothetical protein
MKRALIVTVVAALAGLLATTAIGQPISAAQLQKTTARALRDWRAGVQAGGLLGQQAESEACFKKLERKPSQLQATYCVSLDHFSLLDFMNYSENLRPPYFGADAVFARLDKAVALTTPPADRDAFASHLLTTLDETIHNSKR